VGYPELLRVLGEEAAREVREVRATAERERAAILARAQEEAAAAREALVTRARAEADARRRSRLESIALERERALLVERRRLLADLHDEVLRRLGTAATPELDARLLAELLPEVVEGPFEVIVDPGGEDPIRAVLGAAGPGVAARATVSVAPERRGGVAVVAGRRVLDDTLPARLERAWPELEAALATILGEG
jgi:V/A-type H+-transporting ATPase subunit E